MCEEVDGETGCWEKQWWALLPAAWRAPPEWRTQRGLAWASFGDMWKQERESFICFIEPVLDNSPQFHI